MERIAFLCPGDWIEPEDLAFMLSPESDHSKMPALDLGLDAATREFQRTLFSIHHVAENMTDAAKSGLHRSNLIAR